MPRRASLGDFIFDVVTDPQRALGKTLPKVLGKRFAEAEPLTQALMRLAQRGVGEAAYSDAEGQQFLEELVKQRWGIIPVLGLQGGGKTVFSIYMAEKFGYPVYVAGMHEDQIPPHYNRLNSINHIMQLPLGSTVILDDVSQLASVYSVYAKEERQSVIDFVTQCRHQKLYLIINGQNSRAINTHLFDTLETLFYKVPPLSGQLERPAMRPYFKQIQAAFYGKPVAWQQSHIYCWSTRYLGIISYDARALVKKYGL